MTGRPLQGRLNTIRIIASAYADHLRDRPTHDERKARAVLVALVAAIHNGTLDSLVSAIKPWMREQVAATDALTDGVEHDRLSEAVGQMGMVAADLDDAAALDLPDAYTGIG